MAELSDNASLPGDTEPSGEVSDHSRITEYLNSSDWEERVRVARFAREQVLARRASLGSNGATSAGVTPAPAVLARFTSTESEGVIHFSEAPSSWETKLANARQERELRLALRALEASEPKVVPITTLAMVAAPADVPQSKLLSPDLTRKLPIRSEWASLETSDSVEGAPPKRSAVANFDANNRPRPASARAIAGLAIGLGAGLIIGLAANFTWVYRPATGIKTATSPVQVGNLRADLPEAGLSSPETMAPVLGKTVDDPIKPLAAPQFSGKVAAAGMHDTLPATAADALERPEVSVITPQSGAAREGDEGTRATVPQGDVSPGLSPVTRLFPPDLPDSRRDRGIAASADPLRIDVVTSIAGDGSFKDSDREITRALIVPGVQDLVASVAPGVPLQKVTDADSTPEISQGVPFAAGGSYHILIHMARGQSDTATRAQLYDLGLMDARRILTDLVPAQTTVAYYSGQDADVAKSLARQYDGILADMTGLTPAPPAHTLDLYFKD